MGELPMNKLNTKQMLNTISTYKWQPNIFSRADYKTIRAFSPVNLPDYFENYEQPAPTELALFSLKYNNTIISIYFSTEYKLEFLLED